MNPMTSTNHCPKGGKCGGKGWVYTTDMDREVDGFEPCPKCHPIEFAIERGLIAEIKTEAA